MERRTGMELVSINISSIKTIELNGKKISTGIFKKPTAGSIYIGTENIAGDKQADLKNHGGKDKAVYAFSSDHYSYWASILKDPDLKPGAFGENLTISGLDEAQIHIGDIISIGKSLLEVSQPRVPCFKLGMALNNKNLPKLFIDHGATGVYFRVLEQGHIKPGDKVEVIKSEPSKVAVKSLFRAYFDNSFEEAINVIERAIDLSQLAEEWRGILPRRLEKLQQKSFQ